MYAWNSNKLMVSYSPRHSLYGSFRRRQDHIKLVNHLRTVIGDESEVILQDQSPIWIRDWYPVQLSQSQILFRVATDYMDANEASEVLHHQTLLRSAPPEQKAKLLQSSKPITSCDVVLDGGNVVMDERHVFISSKVYRDNPSLSSSELYAKLSSLFEGRTLLILDAERDDPTGHLDGQLQFLTNSVLLINDLSAVEPNIWRSNLRQLAKLDLQIVPLPYKPSDVIAAGWPVMDGNYINVVATCKCILFSSYGDIKVEEKIKRIIERFDHLKRRVAFVKSRPLDYLGGGLHCITWNVE